MHCQFFKKACLKLNLLESKRGQGKGQVVLMNKSTLQNTNGCLYGNHKGLDTQCLSPVFTETTGM